ncbi:MAG: glycoside hydrolase family 38 C-terminal domain-containing protein [Bacteroidales bacterium]|jgi:alpha-mannosidase|nr:glycoside hydrolase family 38 C-terminal domain-containing protein [Bacteroidales bacterium]
MKRLIITQLILLPFFLTCSGLLADAQVRKSSAAVIPSQSVLELSASRLSNGEILLMNSSHQDLAWMDLLEKCIIERDTMLMTPLLKAAQKDPGYRFDIEDVLMIKEYIGRHPESARVITGMLKDGRLTCGSTYQMPYEEMYSGESLVRQFYLGARWIRENMGDYNADTYWNPDVPGRTMQMAQIMAKSGTRNLIMSRHEKGVYKWYSPDGSFIYAYSPGHYSEDFLYLGKSFPEASDMLARKALYWSAGYNDVSAVKPVIPVLSDWDMSPAKDYSTLISEWNSLTGYKNKKGNILPLTLPKIRLATAPEFLKKISESTADLKEITGERPAVWLYIHGPSHEWALKASREGDIMMTIAEKFSTIEALLKGSFVKYPEERLLSAWEDKIYPDHGWGGNGGESTDAIFLEKYRSSLREAEGMTAEALNGISSKVKTNTDKGIPVMVFNSLSWQRDDPVSFTMNFMQGRASGIKVTDASGHEVPVQLSEAERYADNSLKKIKAHFIAAAVPSIGYKTYYILPGTAESNPGKSENRIVETPFYRIQISEKGVNSIFDKELNIELLHTGKIFGGDVFTMKSVGNGAGEFADIQQPEMEGFDIASDHSPAWELDESGPVYMSFKMRQPIRNAVVESTLKVYRSIKKIDFDVSLLNWEGVLYREYRFAMPLAMKRGQVSYEVPFGVLEVGKDEISGAAGERYTTLCSDVHPRGVENWIGASDDRFGVTLSTSTAVADYIDPTGLADGALLLQPVLLASRKSCHHLGNEYLQTGNHYFHFSLTSHKPGFENGFKFGRQANEKLLAVVDPIQSRYAFLDEECSFFRVDAPNISISAIKKSEDSDETIIRFYETGISQTEFGLNSWFNIEAAEKTSMIEYDGEKIPHGIRSLPLSAGSHSIETIKLKLK